MSAPGPLVSVVIPCFNYGRFLGAAITSVQRQEYRPIEIIVIDDASTDQSAAVASNLGVRVIRQPGLGLGAARNAGVHAAGGELIVFLDADDELAPEAISSGAHMLLANPAAPGVIRLCEPIDADGAVLPSIPPDLTVSPSYAEWLQQNFLWTTGAAMFRRAWIIESGSFLEDTGPTADYALYLRMARSGSVVSEQRVAVRYRQHGDNMSGDPVKMLMATLDVLEREQRAVSPELWREFAVGRRAWRRFYGERIAQRLRTDWHTGWGVWHLTALWALSIESPRVLLENAVRRLARAVSRSRMEGSGGTGDAGGGDAFACEPRLELARKSMLERDRNRPA
jgi:glycosyltransferase involved in cell wall biosynthesis